MYFLAWLLRGPRINDMSGETNTSRFCFLNTIIYEKKSGLLKEIIHSWTRSGKARHETAPSSGLKECGRT